MKIYETLYCNHKHEKVRSGNAIKCNFEILFSNDIKH